MLDPQLMILDEPSMGLDPQTRGIVFETVALMNRQGRTILLVEQNARAGLALAHDGVVLENGQVRLVGLGARGPRAPRDRRALPRRLGRGRRGGVITGAALRPLGARRREDRGDDHQRLEA